MRHSKLCSAAVVLLLGVPLIALCARSKAGEPPPAEQVGADLTAGTALVPTGQRLRPAGRSLTFPGRPVDLALSPDGRRIYLKDNRGVVVVDTPRWTVLQELKMDGGTSLHGIAVSADGTKLYATDAGSHLAEGAVGPDGTIAWTRQIPVGGAGKPAYPCGIALHPDGQRALVCLSCRNSLAIVRLSDGKTLTEIPVGIAPWGVALTADGKAAWISDWGGRRPRPGEATAPSAGTPTKIDARGIADSGCVSLVDLESGKEVTQIAVGLHPSDMCLRADGHRLYVANANSDTISVIDTTARRVAETIPVRPTTDLPFGSAPNGLALSPDGRTLYAAAGGNNAIAVISLGDGTRTKSRLAGLIPAGWYPGAVATDRAGTLYAANVKGVGSRAPETGSSGQSAKGWRVQRFLGSVQQIPPLTASRLRAETAEAIADARLPESQRAYTKSGRKESKPLPVPAHPGAPSVFMHVVYILKENRTYDQLFGDIPRGNGDPALCTFGRRVTPNHHALAEQFVLLDNFYCNGAISADGHSWATEGNVTDHLEKAFGGFTRSYTFGDDPLTYSSSGFLWDNALAHGRSFRNYGEMDYAGTDPKDRRFAEVYHDYFGASPTVHFTHSIGIENLRRFSSPNYPGWNTSIPDVVRADIFLKDLKTAEARGTFPDLTLLYLPNDHTGADVSPESYLADNDLALGRVVEGISRSRFWPKTCIFVMEDDPQSGWDHVDGHRSPCLVISPYTKRGAVVHAFYNQTSVLHTMEQILGLPPMNQQDAAAPLMTACFTDRPDLRPYRAVPNTTPLVDTRHALNTLRARSRFWADLSRKVRFDAPDASDDAALNRLLWLTAKGLAAPYPAAGRSHQE